MINNWVDFIIEDLTWDESESYTLRSFEKMCKDKVVAVELYDKGFDIGKPKYIWTEKYCFIVLTFRKLGMTHAIVQVPRNPDYK